MVILSVSWGGGVLDSCKLIWCMLPLVLYSDDRVRFFCLQVLEYHVRTRHASSSDDDILALRKLLMEWMQPRKQEVGVWRGRESGDR